ncbi:MAG: sigma-70 family RNA polymerase sigma factor, partial [Solirubrobacterales bacterium]|nr:sigma-70 family RNA polymerase sigma factor [Solirubrobacterales bacterium]
MTRSDPRRTSRALRLLRDDRLATRAREGEPEAFAELYRRYHQRIYRYSLSLLRTPDDAADNLQTTMAKALAALEDEAPVERVRPWLFRIAHNEAISLLRTRRPEVDVEELSPDQIPSSPDAPTEAAGRAELTQLVADVQDLPERHQSALVMRELSGLSYDEIAAALETSPLACRQLVHQARSALHDQARGREMECESVRHALGDAEGRTPRNRRYKAHLTSCEDCRGFQHSLRTRPTGLAAFAPPLAPAAASEILRRLLEQGSTHGGVVTAGGAMAGVVAKVAGASSAGKLAAAAAAAVVAAGGAAVVAERIVSDPAKPTGVRPPDAGEVLQRDVSPLRPFGALGRRPHQENRAAPARGPLRKRRLSVASSAETPISVPVADATPDVGSTPADRTETAVTRQTSPPTHHHHHQSSGGDVVQPKRDSGDDDSSPELTRVTLPPVDRLKAQAEIPIVPPPAVDVPQVELPPVDLPAGPPAVSAPDTPPVDAPTIPVDPPAVPPLPSSAPDTGVQ